MDAGTPPSRGTKFAIKDFNSGCRRAEDFEQDILGVASRKLSSKIADEDASDSWILRSLAHIVYHNVNLRVIIQQ